MELPRENNLQQGICMAWYATSPRAVSAHCTSKIHRLKNFDRTDICRNRGFFRKLCGLLLPWEDQMAARWVTLQGHLEVSGHPLKMSTEYSHRTNGTVLISVNIPCIHINIWLYNNNSKPDKSEHIPSPGPSFRFCFSILSRNSRIAISPIFNVGSKRKNSLAPGIPSKTEFDAGLCPTLAWYAFI